MDRMRSPPALRELNVGADRRAQLLLRILRIRLSLLEWIYAVSVRYIHGILYIIEE